MPSKTSTLHASRIVAGIARIRGYTQGMDQAAFLANQLVCDAVAMNLMAIGESALKISIEARALAPEIDWRDVINLRHRIAHGYDDLSFSIIWSVVAVELDVVGDVHVFHSSLVVAMIVPKARRKAVRTVFGEAALVQRCQVHKTRNVLDYLSDHDRPWAHALLRRAYQTADPKLAQRLLLDLARRLEAEYPSAAESVREGLDETLTVLTLKLSPRLRRSLATTNAAESLISRTRIVKRNVKRWRGGQMMLRWMAAGILEAVKGFRRLKGYADMPTLVSALRARDRQLGFLTAEEDRQVA